MIKEPFIRATEIWVPTPDGRHIDLEGGLYGGLDYFAAISRGMRFDFGQGLPGKTWQAGHPIVLKDLRNSYFQRGDAAMTEGLSCAVAVPTFAQGKLSSVLVLFCGDDRFRVGALELWSLPEGELELGLADGYFGRAEKFEFASRHTRFPRGMGVPGRVWASGKAEVLEDLGRGNLFLRRDEAEKVGINRAVGLPCSSGDGKPWVLTFLSARNSPIAGRFEIWENEPALAGFRFCDGYCESGEDLAETYREVVVPDGTGVFARACRKGVPLIDEDLATDHGPVARSAVAAGFKSMVVVPIPGEDGFETLLAWFI